MNLPSRDQPASVQPAALSVPTSADPLIAGLLAVVTELEAVLCLTSPALYTRPAGEVFAGSTVGAHVRHTIDHLSAAVDHTPGGPIIDYDARLRGTPVESDSARALGELRRLGAALRALPAAALARPVSVRLVPSRQSEPVTVGSTLGRELAFALSHTVHHAATIRSIIAAAGVHVAVDFGVAPGTLKHMDAQACAR